VAHLAFWAIFLLIMDRPRHCTGCKTPFTEHISTFGKPGKGFTGPEQSANVSVVEADTTPSSQSRPVKDGTRQSIEATLASLVREVKSLTTGLKKSRLIISSCVPLFTTQSPIPFQLQALAVWWLQMLLCQSCTRLVTTSRSTLHSGWVGGFQ